MEAANRPEHIEEALWWVQRYVCGSIDDPEWQWDGGETAPKLNVNQAFDIVSGYIGNARSVGRPLYRYLAVTRPMAKKIIETKMLPKSKWSFQSFSGTSFDETAEIGRDIHPYRAAGRMELIVSVTPSPADVLFGYRDVKARARLQGVRDVYMMWGDWAHQDEVFVRVTSPLQLDAVAQIKNDTLHYY